MSWTFSYDFPAIEKKCIDVFFDDHGRNLFFEERSDCLFSINDASESETDLNENIWDYLDKKGIILSKSRFILKSKDITPRIQSTEDYPSSILCSVCSSCKILSS